MFLLWARVYVSTTALPPSHPRDVNRDFPLLVEEFSLSQMLSFALSALESRSATSLLFATPTANQSPLYP